MIHQPEFRRLRSPCAKQTKEMEVPLPQQLCVLFSILEFLGIRYPAGNYFISHLCTRKMIFPESTVFGNGSSNHIGSLWWGSFLIQGSYTCCITITQTKLLNQNSYWPSRISWKGRVGVDQMAQLVVSFISASCFIKDWSVKRFTLEFCVDTNHGVFQMVTPVRSR